MLRIDATGSDALRLSNQSWNGESRDVPQPRDLNSMQLVGPINGGHFDGVGHESLNFMGDNNIN